MGASLVVATVILAPFAGARHTLAGRPRWARSPRSRRLGLLCTAVAFVVYTVLIREAGTSRATVITYVNPLVAVVLGVTLLGERPGPSALAGLLLILAGSWLSTGGRIPPPGAGCAAQPALPGRRSSPARPDRRCLAAACELPHDRRLCH